VLARSRSDEEPHGCVDSSLPDRCEGFDVPAGEVYLPIEASKGELGVYMKSDGGPKPSRVHFRGPSFVNLSALPVMSDGEMVADIVAIIGSLDIVLGEIDR
jgi:NADH-quinone oxidoreductase subunit D